METNKNIRRRFNGALAGILSAFEKNFPELQKNDMAIKFKGFVRNAINDAVRASCDELLDADGISSDSHSIKFSPSIAALVKDVKILFNHNGRGLTLFVERSKDRILLEIQDEIGAGIIHYEEDQCRYILAGIHTCVDYAIPFLDNYPFTPEQLESYKIWRSWVVSTYERI